MMNAYTEKKSSGVAWFGEIPQHWRCEHLKRFTKRIQAGMTPPTNTPEYYFDGTIPWFAPGSFNGDIDLREPRKLINDLARSEGELRIFPSETVFLVGIGATIGKVGLVSAEASCNQQLIGIVCGHRMHSRFLAYQFKIYEDVIPGIATATTLPIFDQVKTGYLPVCLPPLAEQQRIAAFLDASCAAIDAAVAAKHRQLETLNALRESTIHRAVTVGLNSAVLMRSSDVEWFDNIPVHWDIDRLKDVVAPKRDAIKVGPFGSDLLLGDMSDEGIKVFNQRTVIDRDFESGIHFISPEKYAEMKAFTVYPGDLLITTRGTIGRCAIVPHTAPVGILHPCLMRVQTKRTRLLPEYLAVLIQDCGLVLRQLQMMSAATTIDVIYSDALKRTYLPLPPVNEQQTILDFIADKNAEFHTLTTQIERQIETLVAYRKSLIHECVTGQRRVTESDTSNLMLT